MRAKSDRKIHAIFFVNRISVQIHLSLTVLIVTLSDAMEFAAVLACRPRRPCVTHIPALGTMRHALVHRLAFLILLPLSAAFAWTRRGVGAVQCASSFSRNGSDALLVGSRRGAVARLSVAGGGILWTVPPPAGDEDVIGLAASTESEAIVVAVRRGLAGFPVLMRALNITNGALLWERAVEDNALALRVCGAVVAAGFGFERDGALQFLDAISGEAVAEDSGARLCEDAPRDGVELAAACGAAQRWDVGTSQLTSDHLGRLAMTAAGGDEVWSREEGLAHPATADFFEHDERGGRVLVVLSELGCVYGLDVIGGGAVLWKVDVTGESAVATGPDPAAALPLRVELVRGHARLVFAVVVTGETETAVFSIDAARGVVVGSIVLTDFAAVQAGLLVDGSPCVVLLDAIGAERSFGEACVDEGRVIPEALGELTWFSAPRSGLGMRGYTKGALAWEAGVPFGGRVIAVATMRRRGVFERPPSTAAVRMTGKRSLLFKYMNPSVALVLSANAEDPSVKFLSGITATLIDSKTGSVLDAVRHPGASEPVAAIRCDNWFVYSFWNADLLEQEVHVVDMYESVRRPPWMRNAFRRYASELAQSLLPGMPLFDTTPEQSGGAKAAREGAEQCGSAAEGTCAAFPPSFASLAPPTSFAPPTLVRSSFVMTHAVKSLGVTVSERGATDRGVIMGLSSGRVVLVSRMVFDPRRPKVASAESASELLLSYSPSLNVWPARSQKDLYAVDGQAVPGLLPERGLITSPVHGRESSCHFAALGLDIVYDTLAPAGKFDSLSDDFNYYGVSASIAILSFAVFAANKAAKRKLLEDHWCR